MSREVSRLKLDGATQVGLRFGVTLEPAEDGAAGNQKRGLVGAGPECRRQLLECLVRVSRRLQQEREIVARGKMLRLQRQDLPVALDRLGNPALAGRIGRSTIQPVGRRFVGFRLGVDQIVLRNRRGEGPQRELLIRPLGNRIGFQSPGAE